MPTSDADEIQNPFHRLQNRHVDVKLPPVDSLNFEHHMLAQYFRHALRCPKSQLLCEFATHGSVINQSSLEPHIYMLVGLRRSLANVLSQRFVYKASEPCRE